MTAEFIHFPAQSSDSSQLENATQNETLARVILDMLLSPVINVSTQAESAVDSATEISPSESESEHILPILPLRGLVVFPETGVPLNVGQERSLRLVDTVANTSKIIGLLTIKSPDVEVPEPEHLYEYGTTAIIQRLFRAPDGTVRLLVQGFNRFRVQEFVAGEPYLQAKVELAPETPETYTPELEALKRLVSERFQRYSELGPNLPEELMQLVLGNENPLQTAYSIANYIRIDVETAQRVLELNLVSEKFYLLLEVLNKELEVLELGRKIQETAQTSMEKVQKEYFLREQLKVIQQELGESDETTTDVAEFRQSISAANLPPEALRETERELARLGRLSSSAAEYGVIRTYLEWMVALPWNKATTDNLNLSYARQVLEEDHFGLEKVKKRIIEFLAVRKLRTERAAEFTEEGEDSLRRDREGTILCFIGPPGVGKTSLGRSIARALGRKFTRISLGGVHDEAEIRGHRRTYIGALPGRIIQAIKRVGSRNPVFILDEIDKLGSDFRGDPASALLEVLDPEQNREFRDHYLDVPFDLSQVFFIATANYVDSIPWALRDRMEVIYLSSYTEQEKLAIAKNYLVRRQLRENGLRPNELTFQDDALLSIIRAHTREAGVRNLERKIAALCRKAVVSINDGAEIPMTISEAVVREQLEDPILPSSETFKRSNEIGIATGMVYTSVGGDVLFIETVALPGGRGINLTGRLGNVMQESAEAAYTWVKANGKEFGIPKNYFNDHEVHIHAPEGATPKDGPSAGITIATALVSLASGIPVRTDVAMTGEITLRGQVTQIGGVKEKVLGAHRAGITTIILPRQNEDDIKEIPEEVRHQLKFILVDRMAEVIQNALNYEKQKS
ncbi:MAG TPA: endopeptidase La [Anaerolineales bacterium]|nr:endopeptidase La [Anaerolineales bacterium]